MHKHNEDAHHKEHDHDHDHKVENYFGKERKLSGKFSGLEKMKKSRKDDNSKVEEKALMFSLF